MNRREFVKMTALAGAGLATFKGLQGKAWAFEQSPLLRKFISPLPKLGSGLPIANGIAKKDGSVLHKLVAKQFHQQMHPDLPNPTKLWGYVDQTTGKPAYGGPVIVANRGTPVRLRFKNDLPLVHPLPVDTTLMGADMGAAQNRAVIHLHGGFVPWAVDGGPFAWFAPDGSHGSSFVNGVPGVKDEAEYYYPNNQSARLLWYHDHAVGITRLNAYAGLASGYLINDDVVANLSSAKTNYLVPPLQYTIPLILQDKSFKKVADSWGRPGDLWYPSLYEYSGAAERWEIGTPSDGFGDKGLPPTPSCVPEFFSDTPVINGEAYPYLEVEPRRYLLAILNAAQARFFNLNLFYESTLNPKEADTGKPGPAFIQIASEGGLLPAPVVLNHPPVLLPYDLDGSVNPDGPYNLLMAPAERAYIIVDFSQCQPGDRLILYNDAPAPFPGGDSRNDYFTQDPDQTEIGGAPSTQPGKGPNTRTLLQFRVVRLKGAPDAWNFNSTLNALAAANGLPQAYHDSHVPFGEPDLNPAGIHREAKTLNEDFDEYGRLVQRVGTGDMLYADSFGRGYLDTPTEVYHNGETVVWDIYNTTGDTHPMHFHLVNVQVLGRDTFATVGDHRKIPTGDFTPPDPNYRGWKETVRVNPGEVTRVIMQFTLPKVPFPVQESPRLKQSYGIRGGHEYVWHCHILEHEEHDMMRPLVVI